MITLKLFSYQLVVVNTAGQKLIPTGATSGGGEPGSYPYFDSEFFDIDGQVDGYYRLVVLINMMSNGKLILVADRVSSYLVDAAGEYKSCQPFIIIINNFITIQVISNITPQLS